MQNDNMITLDGMERIERDDLPVYLPSKRAIKTQREIAQENREPVTREFFIETTISADDFKEAPALDFSLMQQKIDEMVADIQAWDRRHNAGDNIQILNPLFADKIKNHSRLMITEDFTFPVDRLGRGSKVEVLPGGNSFENCFDMTFMHPNKEDFKVQRNIWWDLSGSMSSIVDKPEEATGFFFGCEDLGSMYAHSSPKLDLSAQDKIELNCTFGSMSGQEIGRGLRYSTYKEPRPTTIDFASLAAASPYMSTQKMYEFLGVNDFDVQALEDELQAALAETQGMSLNSLVALGNNNVATNIDEFDALTGGFGRGQLTLIGATFGAGRTQLLRDIGCGIVKSSKLTPFVLVQSEFARREIAEEFEEAINEIANGDAAYCLEDSISGVKELLLTIRERLNECNDDTPAELVMIDDLDRYNDEGNDFLYKELRMIALEFDVAMVGTCGLRRRGTDASDLMWPDYMTVAMADKAITMNSNHSNGLSKMTIVKNRDTGKVGDMLYYDRITRDFCPF